MSENLMEGLTLLAMGMGFVLSFLCIMILCMNIMSKVVTYLNKLFPEAVNVTENKTVTKSIGDDVAAIALALAVAKLKK